MPQAEVQLPDGKKARIEFTDQAQLDATISDLVKSHAAPAPSAPHGRNAFESVEHGVGEPMLQAVTGMGASAWGGVKGIARGAGEATAALASGQGAGKAADAFTDAASEEITRAQQDLTYQPRTLEGQAVSKAVQTPFRLIAEGADWAGQKAATGTEKGLEKLGVSQPTASRAGAAVGATVNTIGQAAAPGAALKGVSRLARPAAAAEEAGAASRGTPGSTAPKGTLSPNPPTSRGPRLMLLGMALIGLAWALARERRSRASRSMPRSSRTSIQLHSGARRTSSASACPYPPPAGSSPSTLLSYEERRSLRQRTKEHPSGTFTLEQTKQFRRIWKYCAAEPQDAEDPTLRP